MWYLVVMALVTLAGTLYVTVRINQFDLNSSVSSLGDHAGPIRRFGLGLFWLMAIVMFILVAFRAEHIGADTANYMRMFRLSIEDGVIIDSDSYLEYGYQLLSWLVSLISQDQQAIIIAVAAITYGLFVRFTLKHTVNPWLVMALFFASTFSSTMNQIRQRLVEVILLYAYQAVLEKKWKKAILCSLIAGTIHTVGFIFLLYILVVRWKFYWKLVSVCMIGLLGLSMTGSLIIKLVSLVFPQYAGYLSGDRVGDGWLAITFSLVQILVTIVIYIFGTKTGERKDSTKWILAFATAFCICGYVSNIFGRLSSTFIFLVFIPVQNEILLSHKKNGASLSLLHIVFRLGCFMFTLLYRPEWHLVFPYQFFFQ